MSDLTDNLARIQRELKAPKGQYNDFGKYKYRSCEDIVEAVKLILNGCTLTLSDEIVMVGDRHYVKATAIISHGSDSGSVTAYAREQLTKKGMDESQITGSASSYARKYALNGLFLIDDTKDADCGDNTAPPPAKLVSSTQAQTISLMALAAGVDVAAICSGYKVKDLADLPYLAYDGIVKTLKERAVK